MANKQINDFTHKPILDDTDSFLVQEAGGVTKRVEWGDVHEQKHGFYNYDNAGAAQTVVADNTYNKLECDTLGGLTQRQYRPTSMDADGIWNPTTNQFDFSQLNLGDEVEMRLDFDITTGSVSQDIDTRILFDIGGQNFSLMVDHIIPKAAGLIPNHIAYVRIFIGSEGVRNNPAELQLRADSGNDLSILVHGWYISIVRR